MHSVYIIMQYTMTTRAQFSAGRGISRRATEFVLCRRISMFTQNYVEFEKWLVRDLLSSTSVYIHNIRPILSLQAASKSLYSTAGIASWTLSGCVRCLICCFLRELLLNSNNKLSSFAIFKLTGDLNGEIGYSNFE